MKEVSPHPFKNFHHLFYSTLVGRNLNLLPPRVLCVLVKAFVQYRVYLICSFKALTEQ